MTAVSQILGIIRYEALMQFRRRTLILIVTLFAGGMIVIGSGLTSATSTQEGEIQNIDIEGNQMRIEYLTPQGERLFVTRVIDENEAFAHWIADVDVPFVMNTFNFLITFLPGLIVLVVAIPPLMTEVIPLDTRFKMDELIWTKPLPKAAYLTGKVLSTWLGFAALLLIAAVVLAVYGLSQYERFDLWVYVRFWLFGVLPLAAIISGYAVLLGGLTKSRRVALFIGLAAIGLSVWALISSSLFMSIMNFMIVLPGQPVYDTYEANTIGMFNTILSGMIPLVALLLALGFGMWAYTRAKIA